MCEIISPIAPVVQAIPEMLREAAEFLMKVGAYYLKMSCYEHDAIFADSVTPHRPMCRRLHLQLKNCLKYSQTGSQH